MKSDKVIRPGDRVKVIRPERVLRVGYPRSLDDYFVVAKEKYGQDLRQDIGTGHPYIKALKQIAYGLAKKDHFGGPVRSVHLGEVPEILGKEFSVFSVRTVQTGTYYPPQYLGREDGSIPGGLSNQKPVRLVRICWFPSFHTEMAELPASHLEKVEDARNLRSDYV